MKILTTKRFKSLKAEALNILNNQLVRCEDRHNSTSAVSVIPLVLYSHISGPCLSMAQIETVCKDRDVFNERKTGQALAIDLAQCVLPEHNSQAMIFVSAENFYHRCRLY